MAQRQRPPVLPTPLPQRTLRNDIARVLREAEAGARFAVTVSGRVVAELGPPSQPAGADWQTAHEVIRRARAHPDPAFWRDIGGRVPDDPEDPWRRAATRTT